MTATEPAAETVLAVADDDGFVALDDIYIQDTGTLANSEWAKVQEVVTDTSITITDGLTTEKDSSDVLWGSAQRFTHNLDLFAVGRLRVIFMHEGAAGANMHVRATMVTCDSIA
jgi:hypothetical protein